MIGIGKNLFKANVKSGGAVVYDADAQAYFTANTAITSAADKNAINTFYLGLKSDGIYTKIKAMYLPIWGSAASSKWNLINPLDTNAAFRLTFSTGWTFSSSGMTPNGSSAYADTFLTPSTSLSLNSTHLCYYSRTNLNILNQYEIGSSSISGVAQYCLMILRDSNIMYSAINTAQGNAASTTNTDSTGLFIANRTASNVLNGFRNGSKIINSVNNSSVLPTNKISIGAMNSGTIGFYTQKQCSFSSIGNGLTDTEAANFSSRVNTLMTYFGINTY